MRRRHDRQLKGLRQPGHLSLRCNKVLVSAVRVVKRATRTLKVSNIGSGCLPCCRHWVRTQPYPAGCRSVMALVAQVAGLPIDKGIVANFSAKDSDGILLGGPLTMRDVAGLSPLGWCTSR